MLACGFSFQVPELQERYDEINSKDKGKQMPEAAISNA
jgi:hypothetical protein